MWKKQTLLIMYQIVLPYTLQYCGTTLLSDNGDWGFLEKQSDSFSKKEGEKWIEKGHHYLYYTATTTTLQWQKIHIPTCNMIMTAGKELSVAFYLSYFFHAYGPSQKRLVRMVWTLFLFFTFLSTFSSGNWRYM